MLRFQSHLLLRLLATTLPLLLKIVYRYIVGFFVLKELQNNLPTVFLFHNSLSFMTFKSTKYAKIVTDSKKYGLFDNIKFPQLRFHCKYYKKKCI